MLAESSIQFFEAQFQRQVGADDLHLNPFEEAALPWVQGRVLDYGCGLGNLALAAARRGCRVLALDASPTAVTHLQQVAVAESLSLQARQEDLRTHRLDEEFDTIVCIGLLMFFDCDTAWHKLEELQGHLRPGGVMVLNVLEEGTTYLDMFDPQGHCLFPAALVEERFRGWEVRYRAHQLFPAPNAQVKAFVTVVARKPAADPVS